MADYYLPAIERGFNTRRAEQAGEKLAEMMRSDEQANQFAITHNLGSLPFALSPKAKVLIQQEEAFLSLLFKPLHALQPSGEEMRLVKWFVDLLRGKPKSSIHARCYVLKNAYLRCGVSHVQAERMALKVFCKYPDFDLLSPKWEGLQMALGTIAYHFEQEVQAKSAMNPQLASQWVSAIREGREVYVSPLFIY